jgi:hypothetical protein
MEDKKILLDNIDKIHTTEMGIDRIKRNLKIEKFKHLLKTLGLSAGRK